MTDRKPVDWEAVEREYRAGVLSVREIANGVGVTHVAIIKRAKAKGWTQNLAGRVKEEIARRLVTSEVTDEVTGNQRQIVEAAALRSVDVILAHRKTIARHRAIADGLEAELQTENGKDEKARLPLKDRVAIFESLTRSAARFITLERQAFGLDDDTKTPDEIEASDAASPRGEVERRIARLAAAG